MGLSETLLIVLGAAVLMALILGLLLRGTLRAKAGSDDPQKAADVLGALETLRSANGELSQKLAIEQFRQSRLGETETALAGANIKAEALREAKSGVEADLSAARQETAGLKTAEKDLRQRLETAGAGIAALEAEIARLRIAKAAVDETLAGRTTALAGSEDAIGDLKRRLEAVDLHGCEQEERLTGLRNQKAAVDESLSARTEALRNSDEQIEGLRVQVAEIVKELSVAQGTVVDLKTANATVRETLDQEHRQADEKIALLTAARVEMSREFKTLAEEVMSRHGESFTKLNKEQIDGILTPLREKLGEFERNVQASHVESVKERATLAEQIRNIAETGAAMGKETKDLTEALRGRSQTQGAWGEMVLETILERSGLRSGEEYSAQKSFADEEGKRLRPDVVINLPGGQRMVVDAKVSLTAFESLVNAASDEERAVHLQRHLGSIRGHIVTLGSKEYHVATGTTLDYVVMFVPIEGALAAALQADPSLIVFAAERNVTLTTPTTLMIALRTVANVWQVERRNQNAEEIAVRAGKLYDKFVGFVADMTAVGDSMTRSRNAFDGAMGKLVHGRGNVIRQLEQLKSMGGRTSKSLPAILLDAADGQVTLALTTHVTETEVTTETTTDVVVTAPAYALTD